MLFYPPVQVNNETYLAENLERLGNSALNRDQETDLGKYILYAPGLLKAKAPGIGTGIGKNERYH